MLKKFIHTLCLILCISALPAVTWGAPVVANPSFEADPWTAPYGTLDLGTVNTLTGWSVIPRSPYPWGLQNTNSYDEHGDGVHAGPTPYGDQWVIVGHYGQGGSAIYQTVSGFIVGQTYTLSFALASEFNNEDVGALVEVSFTSGSSTPSQIFEAPLRAYTYWDTWEMFSMDFVADSTDVTIQFFGLAGLSGYDAGIDNVSIAQGSIEVDIDIKPGSCPNPLNTKSKGVLPVAVLGTDEFDVTTIDPVTIRLSREVGEEVAPIRSDHEDVATPFGGELCDCHDLNGDGYLDLTLKFSTQELVQALELQDVIGETIPLTLTGNLQELNGNTPIIGADCIWVNK